LPLNRSSGSLVAGEVDGGDHVALGGGKSDGCGPLVDQQVERLAGGIPVGVAGADRPAGHDVRKCGGGVSICAPRSMSRRASTRTTLGASRQTRVRHPSGLGSTGLGGLGQRRPQARGRSGCRACGMNRQPGAGLGSRYERGNRGRHRRRLRRLRLSDSDAGEASYPFAFPDTCTHEEGGREIAYSSGSCDPSRPQSPRRVGFLRPVSS
jgi:hypothetical protein